MNPYYNYLGELTTSKGVFQAQLRTIPLGFAQVSMGCGSWKGCLYIFRGHDQFDDDKFEFTHVKLDSGDTIEASSLKPNDVVRVTHIIAQLEGYEFMEYPFTPQKI